jgi:hypothetical protein
VVATGAVVVAVLWSGVAIVISELHVAAGRDDGSEPVAALVKIRIAALQARTDETLTLVAHGGGASYEAEFGTLFKQFAGDDGAGGQLAEAKNTAAGPDIGGQVDTAIAKAKAWRATHQQIRDLDNRGDYKQAVQLAIGADPAGAAVTSNDLDTALFSAINKGRDTFVKKTTSAANTLIGLQIGVVLLALLAAAGVTFGIWQRLREYR